MTTKNQDEKTVLEKYELDIDDTGSSEAQIVILTEKINQLFQHLEDHPKDLHSRRGLVGMVNKRKKLLKYLKKEDAGRYNEIIKKTGLKK